MVSDTVRVIWYYTRYLVLCTVYAVSGTVHGIWYCARYVVLNAASGTVRGIWYCARYQVLYITFFYFLPRYQFSLDKLSLDLTPPLLQYNAYHI